jgi:hypothetical protein
MLQYLQKHKMQPPEDWRGVRNIDDKQEPPPIDYLNNQNEEELDDSDEDQDVAGVSRKS